MMRVFRCSSCTKIHIETGNILLHFADISKLTAYLQELENIDVEYFAMLNKNKHFSKNLFLPVANTNVNLSFTITEFKELKQAIAKFIAAECQTKATFVTMPDQKLLVCLN